MTDGRILACLVLLPPHLGIRPSRLLARSAFGHIQDNRPARRGSLDPIRPEDLIDGGGHVGLYSKGTAVFVDFL